VSRRPGRCSIDSSIAMPLGLRPPERNVSEVQLPGACRMCSIRKGFPSGDQHVRRGRVFRRCRKCGRQVTGRSCTKCGTSGRIGWAFTVDVAPPGAVRDQRVRSGLETKAAAVAAMNELQMAMATATYVEPSRITLAEYLARMVGGGQLGDEHQAGLRHRDPAAHGPAARDRAPPGADAGAGQGPLRPATARGKGAQAQGHRDRQADGRGPRATQQEVGSERPHLPAGGAERRAQGQPDRLAQGPIPRPARSTTRAGRTGTR